MQAFLDVQNAVGRTPLHEAAKNGHLDIVKRFVSLGASMDILDNDGKTAFELGKNHIEVASYLGHRMSDKYAEKGMYDEAVKMLEELLEVKEEALGSDHPDTAKTRGHIGSMRSWMYISGSSDTKPPLFLSYLEERNDGDGKTPLHAAAETGQLPLVERFVGFGVNINILDNDGKSAFDLAKDYPDVAGYLGYRMIEKFRKEEKHEDALKIFEELVGIQEKALGYNHSETAKTRKLKGELRALLYAMGRL